MKTLPSRAAASFAAFMGTRPEVPALFALFTLALVVRLDFLFADEFARGADGYYYAAQVKHYLERGSLFGSDSSLILRVLIAFSYPASLAGLDIVASNKIAIALLGALLVPAAFLLGRTIPDTDNKRVTGAAGLLLAVLYTSASAAVWFHIEFVKNLGGILVFILFAAYLRGALAGNRLSIIAAAICLVLTLLCHKLMGGFALIFAGGAIVFAGTRALRARSPRLLSWLFVAGGGTALLVILLGLIFPGVLSMADFSRFENLFVWPPVLHLADYNKFIHPPAHHRLEFLAMALVPLPALALFAVNLARRRMVNSASIFMAAMFLVMYVICMNPILRFRGLDFSFRLLITLFVPAGYLLVFALSRLPARAVPPLAYALVLLGAALQMPAFRTFPIRAKVNYALYDKIVPLLVLPEDSLLIAHQSLDNFYYYVEGKDAFRFMPEKKHFKRPVYRLAWGIAREDLRKYMPRGVNMRFLPGRYVLMREEAWSRFTKRLPRKRKKVYRNWKNPHGFRPGFIRRGKQ